MSEPHDYSRMTREEIREEAQEKTNTAAADAAKAMEDTGTFIEITD